MKTREEAVDGRGAPGRMSAGGKVSVRGWGLGSAQSVGDLNSRVAFAVLVCAAICTTAGAVSVNVDGLSVNVTVSSIVGSGAAAPTDGTRAVAGFSSPRGVAAINDTFVAVADSGSHRIRMVNSVTGETTTLAGGAVGFWNDHNGFGLAQFSSPSYLALIRGTPLLVVSDTGNHALRVLDTASRAVWTLAGTRSPGLQNGKGNAAAFSSPGGVAVSADGGTVYVADEGNNCIRKVSYPSGDVSLLAGSDAGTSGDAGGGVGDARFSGPRGVALSPDGGVLFVADTGNGKIKAISLGGTQEVTTLLGGGISAPTALEVTPDGVHLIVVAAGNSSLLSVHTTTGQVAELLTGADGLSSPGGVALFLGGTAAALSDAGTHQLRLLALHVTSCGAMELQNGLTCQACPAAIDCSNGSFRGACDWREMGACVPCSMAPAAARYTSHGSPPAAPGEAGRNDCSWLCPERHFVGSTALGKGVGKAAEHGMASLGDLSSLSCLPCADSVCLAGSFRSQCQAAADSQCVSCEGAPEEGAEYVVSEPDWHCIWQCQRGFFLLGKECVPEERRLMDLLYLLIIPGLFIIYCWWKTWFCFGWASCQVTHELVVRDPLFDAVKEGKSADAERPYSAPPPALARMEPSAASTAVGWKSEVVAIEEGGGGYSPMTKRSDHFGQAVSRPDARPAAKIRTSPPSEHEMLPGTPTTTSRASSDEFKSGSNSPLPIRQSALATLGALEEGRPRTGQDTRSSPKTAFRPLKPLPPRNRGAEAPPH